MSDSSGTAPSLARHPAAGGSWPGWIALFVRNRVAGNVLMILLVVGGILAASRLDVHYLPDVDPKRIYVTVPYPGASPAEVEERVTGRLEERLRGLDGVGWVASRASAGRGEVTLNLSPWSSTERVLEDARQAVGQLEAFPPRDAERPQLDAGDWASAVIVLAVSSRSASPLYLRRAAEDLRESLLALPAVSDVRIRYSPEREVSVEVDEEALREHGLSMAQIRRKLNGASVDGSTGELDTRAGIVVPRVRERRRTGEDLEDIVLRAGAGGGVVRLGDVATVRDELAHQPSVSEMDGIPTLFVAVYDVSEAATNLDVVYAVRQMLESYQPLAGVQVSVWQDVSLVTLDGVNSILYAGIVAAALVAVALALVLDLRTAMWVALGVPVSFLGALLLFPAFDLSINAATLFALVFAVGIVVDDAVVVGESIVRQRELGLAGPDAAVAGSRLVLRPVALGLATTMIATLPALFVHDALGQLLNAMPVVIVLTLGVSMTEAFLILPSHLAHGGAWSRWPLAAIQARFSQALNRLRDRRCLPAIDLAVRYPARTLLVSAVVVLGALALVASGVVPVGYQQVRASDRVSARLTYPAGTPIEVTEAGARRLVAAAERTNEGLADAPIAGVGMLAGHYFSRPSRMTRYGTEFATHFAGVQLRLAPEAERSVTAEEVGRRWHDEVGEVEHGGALAVTASPAAPSYDVTIALMHPDSAVLAQAVDEVADALGRIDGVFQVDHTLDPGKRQYQLELTPTGHAAGLDVRSVAAQIRARFVGVEAQRDQRNRDEVAVKVRYPETRRGSIAELLDERIDVPTGGQIPLSEAVNLVPVREPELLLRIDGVPAAEVQARVDHSVTTAVAVGRQLRNDALPDIQARHPGLAHRQMGDFAAFGESLEVLAYTVPMVLFAMYLLIAVQCRSFGQPLVILATVPLAAAGAVFLHLILGYQMIFASLLGIVAVVGVAINDTLLLMDRYNAIRAESGVSAAEAVRSAVRLRFRPIVLTTATTFVGLLPVLYVPSEVTTRLLLPIILSLIGGLAAASAGILFVVPAILMLAERAGLRRRRSEAVDSPA